MNNEINYTNSESATHRLILLHGWGADAEDLMPLAKEIINTDQILLEIVSLRAPEVHPQGIGRMWYPLFPHDWDAVPSAVEELELRIRKIANNQIPLSKTILLGFSQGGAMALEMAFNLPLRGVIACSSYTHPGWKPHSNMTPIFLTHGKNDDVVPFDCSEKTINTLKKYNVPSDLFLFDGGHEIQNILIKQFRLIINQWMK